jgi:hypothetical protein
MDQVRALGRVSRRCAAALAAAGLAACTSSAAPGPGPSATGPARVQPGVVARHAEQFDNELPRRPAGSQQEQAAAVYIVGHLQRAGYTPRLEAVPVANTVNSTDVITLPPGTSAPTTVVAVPYDTAPGAPADGASIGLFLEVARALKAAEPRHSVEFAALGAERTTTQGAHLGARRLARLLLDEGHDPLIVTIEALGGRAEGRFGAFGPEVGDFTDIARRLDIPVIPLPAPDPAAGRDLAGRAEIFERAGFDHVAVTGGVKQVGEVLLAFLTSSND